MRINKKVINGTEMFRINDKGRWKKWGTQSSQDMVWLYNKVEELSAQLGLKEALLVEANIKIERKDVLLKATSDILKKNDDSYYVTNFSEMTAFYDGTECDGYCLWEDIKDNLGETND